MGQAALTHSSSTGLWLPAHQQGLHLQPPCPTPWGTFRRFLATSAALSLWKRSSQEVLLPRSILQHLLECHTLGKHTLSLSHSPAIPSPPQSPPKSPFFTTQGCL